MSLEKIVAHPGGHHLITASGQPFFWLADTAWELFHRTTRAEAEHYFDIRSRQGFNGVPDQALLPEQVEPPQAVGAADAELRHPERAAYAAAWRCAGGTFAMVYFPLAEQRLAVDLGRLAGPVTASWYDPRTGRSHPAGHHGNSLTHFTSPIAGPDWVLVLAVTT